MTTALCPACELPLASEPAPACSSLHVHRLAAAEIGRLVRKCAEAITERDVLRRECDSVEREAEQWRARAAR